MLKNMVAKYNRLLITDPYKTKMLTSGFVFAGGDILCQLFFTKTEDGQKAPFSWRRLGKMACIGIIYAGPILHHWFKFISRFVSTRYGHLSQFQQAFISTGFDRAIFALPYNFFLLAGVDYFENGDFRKAAKNISSIFPNYCINNLIFLSPAVFINYRFVPNQYRVLYSNMTGLLWNIYLSYCANDAVKDKEAVSSKWQLGIKN